MSTTTRAETESVEPREPDEVDGTPTGRTSRGWRRRGLIVGVSAVAALGAAWLAFSSPLLAVDQVKVTGNGSIPTSDVVSASGVVTGVPMLTLDTSAAAERVSQMDTVASATVTRRWPDTLAIAVVPDAAVAVSANGDQWDVWGAAGGRLATVPEPPADLPELRDVPEQSRTEALTVTGSLPPDVRARVSAVSLQEGRGYLLALRDDAGTVRWGDAADTELKATVLAAMMLAAPDARWFDVSSPTAPRSAVAEPVRTPRNGAVPTPSPTPTDGAQPAQPAQPDPGAGAEPSGGGGESPLGLQPQ